MKILWSRLFILGAVLFSSISSADEKWVLDNQHSYVRWEINHLDFSMQTGKWYVDGVVWLDEKQPDKSRVEVSVDIAKIITGIPELDKHLMGAQFFDVKQFPKATFVSNKVEVMDKTHAKVKGMLTLHGVTKPVELMVTLNQVGKNPVYDRQTAGFKASTHSR